jgi:hypothetical protein
MQRYWLGKFVDSNSSFVILLADAKFAQWSRNLCMYMLYILYMLHTYVHTRKYTHTHTHTQAKFAQWPRNLCV